jgi:hypothetical protein
LRGWGGEGGGGVGGKGGGGGRGDKWPKPCMHIWIIKEKFKKNFFLLLFICAYKPITAKNKLYRNELNYTKGYVYIKCK